MGQKNQQVAHDILHSARYGMEKMEPSRLGSVFTLKSVASSYIDGKWERVDDNPLAIHEDDEPIGLMIEIKGDARNPPKGYVLEENFGTPWHEIQLSQHNTYSIVGLSEDEDPDFPGATLLMKASCKDL